MPALDDIFARYKGNNTVFVETGTFLGDGVRRALEAGYASIYSIEINEGLVARNRQQFETQKNVTIVHGDSSKDLSAILANVPGAATFWLDGHYSNNPLTGYNPEHRCPILLELDQIREHRLANPATRDHVVMIDDVRFFRCTGDRLDGYFQLSIDSVIDRLMQINPNYRISYEDGIQKDDILVAHVS